MLAAVSQPPLPARRPASWLAGRWRCDTVGFRPVTVEVDDSQLMRAIAEDADRAAAAWRALRAGNGIVDRVDFLTRLNRQVGVGTAMISHTMSDLLSLSSEEDRMKARGFVERHPAPRDG